MTDADQAKQQLMTLFETLPDEQLKKLGARIELDRNENQFGLPHQAVISLMRPYLAAARAPRVYTPQRILCVPFEDMFTNEDVGFKRTGFIHRRNIFPFWRLISEELMADSFPPLANRFIAAQKAGDDDAAAEAASAIWAQAATALGVVLDPIEGDANAHEAFAERMGGTSVVEDITEMRAILSIADHVEALKKKLPHKPIAVLTSKNISSILQHYTEIGSERPGMEIYLLLIVIGRLMQPFPILRVFRSLSRKGDDAVIRQTDLSIAGEIVIDALEKDAKAAVQVARDFESSEEEIVRKATRFAAAFKGITTDIGIRRDGEWGQRMYAGRNTVAETIQTRILAKTEKVILGALVKKHAGKLEKLAEWPDEEAFEAAENRAAALSSLYRISDQLGVRAACQNELDSIRKLLNDYSVSLVEELSRLEKSQHQPAFANLAVVVRLLELVANSDEADLLRRRGRAALSGTMLEY